MRHDFVIPNLSESSEGSMPSEVMKDNGNVMLNILNRLNESTETVPETTATEMKTCAKCGVKYEGDGCPKCGTVVEECDEVPAKKEMTESFKRGKRGRMHESEDAGVNPEEVKDPEVAEEKPTTESLKKRPLREADEDAGVTPDEVKDPEVAEEKKVNESTRYRLTRVLLEYCRLCEAEDFEKAKELIEEEEVEVTLDPNGTYEIKEADEEDETQKVTLTEEELEGIEKVEESMSFGKKASRKMNESRKLKKKATKARARRSLSESYRKTRIINAVQKLAMQEGISFSSKKLQRVINEAYRINEAEVELPEEKAQSALEKAFNDAGVVVKECETEVNDGVMTAHLTLQDNDAEVFLGDVADEVAENLEGYDVDYDEPEINEDDDDEEVYVDFHFVPVITSEAEEVEDEESVTESEDEDELGECDEDPKTAAKVNESKKLRRGRKLTESEEVEDEETVNEEDEDEETIKVNEEDEDKDDVFESFAGGRSNVRCKLNPAFIKPGQVIFDSDSRTVFQAMTESVSCKDGFGLGIEVCNSANPKLSRLASGAEVTLSAKGSYYLLRENPTK